MSTSRRRRLDIHLPVQTCPCQARLAACPKLAAIRKGMQEATGRRAQKIVSDKEPV